LVTQELRDCVATSKTTTPKASNLIKMDEPNILDYALNKELQDAIKDESTRVPDSAIADFEGVSLYFLQIIFLAQSLT